MHRDDIKPFVEKERELGILLPKVRIYNQDIGMEFRIEKCAI